jgi:outer membrane lipoprotein carrier protein
MRHQKPDMMLPVKRVLSTLICYVCIIGFTSATSAMSDEQIAGNKATDIQSNVIEMKPELSTHDNHLTEVEVNGAAVALAAELSRVAHMSASFTQQTVDRTLRVLQENTGRLWVNPGAKFRIETDAPSEQTLVSDGSSFWVYDADLEQVIVSKLEADLSQTPVLLLGGNLAEINASYAISYYEDELGQNYVLSPLSSESLFTSLSISFQQSVPVRIAILDALGQRTLINIQDVIVSDQIEPVIFSFEPPVGTDVIDDRL